MLMKSLISLIYYTSCNILQVMILLGLVINVLSVVTGIS